MTTLKLSYFDFDGGRGEPVRMALRLEGIDFEDHRIAISEWSKHRGNYPFEQVPVLEIDGKVLTQSNTINRLIGKMTKLYPDDNWQAALCDEVMDAVDDAVQLIVNTLFVEEAEKKRMREELAAGKLPMYLSALNTKLISNGGEFFSDSRLTIADLKVYVWIQSLLNGQLDYIPTTLVEQHAPDLLAFTQRLGKALAR